MNKPKYTKLAYKYINDEDEDMHEFVNLVKNIEILHDNISNKKDFKYNFRHNYDLDLYMNNIINIWYNENKNNDIKTFDYINDLDENYRKIIYKKIKKNANMNNLKCSCDNTASIKCINLSCIKCCKNVNCKRHYK